MAQQTIPWAPREQAAPAKTSAEPVRLQGLMVYLLLGIWFGILFSKSEVISWFRIQEMFRFQGFHMYGIIGSAILVAAISVRLIKRFQISTLGGEPIVLTPKAWGKGGIRYWVGGTLFGFGWALTGACPGPLFALIGQGVGVIVFTLASAVAGAWVYGALRPKLPH